MQRPGILTTVQDLGRPGFARYGVAPSGALDAFALRVANLLVGNPEDAAALETTVMGLRLKALRDVVAAVTGADLKPMRDREPLAMWRSHRIRAGEVIAFPGPAGGMRSYIAVSGGIDVTPVLGSRSTNLPSGFGGFAGRALRKGEFDVLVGINLLREGLDLPEVSLVAILDADKEGFLRSETSLIQTAGRAARHLNGQVILYAAVQTDSIKNFLAISEYRRNKQLECNRLHGSTPLGGTRPVEASRGGDRSTPAAAAVLHDSAEHFDVLEVLRQLEAEMLEAAAQLEFEKAALLRDQIRELKRGAGGGTGEPKTAPAAPVNYRKRSKRGT